MTPGERPGRTAGEAALRRSLLYVPGSSERMLSRAAERGADVLVLDLEDGVHPDAKAEARQRVADALARVDFGAAEVLVRVNHRSSPWGAEDLAVLAGSATRGVVLPKVSEPAEVAEADARLGRRAPLFLMIETVQGVESAAALARACPRVAGLFFGAADFRESARASTLPDEQELLHARSRLLLAARCAGVDALDAPWFDYGDLEGLERSARLVRGLGFDGKTAVHPAQIPVINRVFAPDAAELERARRVVAALDEAAREGRAVAVLDGEMIEALHERGARRTLERARRLGLEPDEDA